MSFRGRRLSHRAVSLRVLAEQVEHLVVVGKTPDVVFAEDELAVHGDVENPAAARDELRHNLKRILDLSRQTGGAGQVVSLLAVRDPDLHGSS